MSFSISRRAVYAATASLLCLAPVAGQADTAKNVMLFIADGSSWGTWDLASYYEYGAKDSQPYADWSVKMGMTTLPAYANSDVNYGKTYGADPAWDDTPMTGSDTGIYGSDYPNYFAGYHYNRQGYTDSAAAATALSAGEKTINGRVNYDVDGNPMGFISQDMKDAGKAVGVVSSVPFSHATPAGFSAQNISRNNYHEIAAQIIAEDTVDVAFGAGNPMYDDNGNIRPMDNPAYYFMGETEWNLVNSAASPMTLIQTKADFEAIADGTLDIEGRVLGLPQINSTLQQARSGDVKAADGATPTGLAYNDNVPTLETMTKAALNLLAGDDDGLFMMVEGGAVDWAAHANQTDRIIEEMVDFNHSITAAMDWVEANSSWDETLMIVLTDHGNSMPMGMASDINAFDPIPNEGAGVVPQVRWHFDSHTTENTLMWTRGAGSDLIANYVVGNDPYLTSILGFNGGDYFENQSIPAFMAAAAGLNASVAPVPVPAGVWLLGSALVGVAGLRRRAKRAA
ncbi:MAG: alkaline phosphatase [Qingshengfaniella sp.]